MYMYHFCMSLRSKKLLTFSSVVHFVVVVVVMVVGGGGGVNSTNTSNSNINSNRPAFWMTN